MAFSTFPDAARVACASAGPNTGSDASHPAGNRPAIRRSSSAR